METNNLAELALHKMKISVELGKLEREHDKCGVNHILHLILSIGTGGLWLLVWAVLCDQNKRKRKEIEELIDDSRMALIEIDTKLALN